MGRLLILLLLVIAAVWLVRRALRGAPRPGVSEGGSAAPEDLVRCAHCGVHLPRAEARAADGSLYCGDPHARLGPAKR